jgi:hypothetical protein
MDQLVSVLRAWLHRTDQGQRGATGRGYAVSLADAAAGQA